MKYNKLKIKYLKTKITLNITKIIYFKFLYLVISQY
ncbi:hypothetical protein SAMN05421800_11237 [Chryseobacterium balustinum]|uniref:Uncharacterized protein n=1 Tax=Chryseobacterium balustinum TaxID=246 RepID=A0AAX2IL75_9FLAO|nr:hypothetical protein SAMN05421800_11237 [Chryseobacterium balustinum]SQA89952.1 Uncharacterised protein [Chryseobacterium balustinum]